MRGEHCIAGASILSAIAVILLVFVNIGQIKPGPVTSGLYFVDVNVEAYGSTWFQSTNISADGMYNTDTNIPLGSGKGLSQYYRWGVYNACGYQKNGGGQCNSTIFGYPFTARAAIISDIPGQFQGTTRDLSGGYDNDFANITYNTNTSRAGSLMIFVGSIFSLLALITGAIKLRFSFLLATVFSSLSALLLLIGAACWTAIIAKDSIVNSILAAGKFPLGWIVSAGPSLYMTWVAFALMTLSVLPYMISCCTFRRNK